MYWVSFYSQNRKFYFGGFHTPEDAEAACFVEDYGGVRRDCRQEKRRNGPYSIIKADSPPNQIKAANLWNAVRFARR